MKIALPFKFEPAVLLAKLKIAQPYLVGTCLIALFGYTAYVINDALNVQPAATSAASKSITFDRKTIEALRKLDVVSSQVAPTEIGKDNPFSR